MKSSAKSPEGDFGWVSLLCDVREGRMSVDDFLRLIEFEKWLAIFCYRYDFKVFEGKYGPEDLQQDSRRKVVKAVPALEPDNTPSEAAFFGWLKTLVFHTYLDELRKQGKALRHGWVRSDEPVEGLTVTAPEDDFDGRYFLGRFLKFIKSYPAEQQFAVILWLMEDRSLREIKERLAAEGVTVSHVTVGNWISGILDAFRKSLGLSDDE